MKLVPVIAKLDQDGITPLKIIWPDGRILDVDRYKCKLAGKKRLLFYEELVARGSKKPRRLAWVGFEFSPQFPTHDVVGKK